MRYHILATDYDGTIAAHGRVDESTIEALKKLKQSSRKIILVTGRELEDLEKVFPEYGMFDLVVAENGALIYDPQTRNEKLLGERPPDTFIQELVHQGVGPISVGRIIVATWEPHQLTVLEAIKNAGLEHQVIFNKGAVMVLPPGINKARGLEAALNDLKVSFHNVVAVGDAENDNAMLQVAECSAAVANALPAVKDLAAIVTGKDHGAGVEQLIYDLIETDLEVTDVNLKKHYLQIGTSENGGYAVSPYRKGILLAGTSGGGKSTFTSAFLETLIERKYQFCLVDPEGDYIDFADTIVIGDADHEPVMDEIINVLSTPSQNAAVCILAIPTDRRPVFFNTLLTKLSDLRTRTGHPHWFVFDEAHHLAPSETESSFFNIPDNLNNFLLISTNPSFINQTLTKYVSSIIAIGSEPGKTLSEFADIKELRIDPAKIKILERGEAWVWEPEISDEVIKIICKKPVHLLKRHKRKYATADMGDNSFYFKGPGAKLNLKAHNLVIFKQIADGIDDKTWLFHLKKNEYSAWFRNEIHDEELADLVEAIENADNDAASSKGAILALIDERYTA